jgi:hypothetical protein
MLTIFKHFDFICIITFTSEIYIIPHFLTNSCLFLSIWRNSFGILMEHIWWRYILLAFVCPGMPLSLLHFQSIASLCAVFSVDRLICKSHVTSSWPKRFLLRLLPSGELEHPYHVTFHGLIIRCLTVNLIELNLARDLWPS